MVSNKRHDRVRVLLPLPMVQMYDYRVPEDISVAPGMFVSVPLGFRQVNGVIWDINPFDQWGVELGKQLSKSIVPILLQEKPNDGLDSSTKSLIERYLGKS